MSDFSLTLVLRLKTSKIINGVAKVSIKSEKVTPFGGIFHVRELFSRFLGPAIDKVLGLRCTSFFIFYLIFLFFSFSLFSYFLSLFFKVLVIGTLCLSVLKIVI